MAPPAAAGWHCAGLASVTRFIPAGSTLFRRGGPEASGPPRPRPQTWPLQT